jgi:hypothetical protein
VTGRLLSRSLVACGVLAGSLLAGCAVAGPVEHGGGVAQGAAPAPRADLAERAEVAAGHEQAAPAGPRAAGRQRRSLDADAGTAGSAPRTGGRGAGPRPPSSWALLRTATDPGADQGAGPGYADALELTLAEDATHLRIAVRLGGAVPARLAGREVQGIGVDLFRGGGAESDFQVFLDGGDHGWRGFLQTPDGFVRFPGTVTVAGATVTSVLPWASLGGRATADVSAFVDWADGAGRAGVDTVARGPLRPR